MIISEHWIILLSTLVPLLVIICIVDGVQNSKQRKHNEEVQEALDVAQKAILKINQRIDELESQTDREDTALQNQIHDYGKELAVLQYKDRKGEQTHDTN